jgi:hypothetical protein
MPIRENGQDPLRVQRQHNAHAHDELEPRLSGVTDVGNTKRRQGRSYKGQGITAAAPVVGSVTLKGLTFAPSEIGVREMPFEPGDIAECVHDDGQVKRPATLVYSVKRGNRYTVTRSYERWRVGECLEFSELPNPPCWGFFPAKYFRKIEREHYTVKLEAAMSS